VKGRNYNKSAVRVIETQ